MTFLLLFFAIVSGMLFVRLFPAFLTVRVFAMALVRAPLVASRHPVRRRSFCPSFERSEPAIDKTNSSTVASPRSAQELFQGRGTV
jgi:hypothetical protein